MATRRMSAAARTNVLLEDMRSRIDAVGELVISSKEELDRKFGERFERIEQRLDRVEDAIRHHSKEIAELRKDVDLLRKDVDGLRKDVDGLRKDVDGLRVEVRQLRHDFDHRDETARLETLERRVAMLEKRRPH